MHYILIQVIGAFGLLMMVLSFQQKTQKRILLVQLMGNLIFTVHFFLLGAYVGSLINFISAFRAAIYSQSDKKWATSPLWAVLFICTFIGTGILTWENIFSILPITGAIITTFSLRIKNPKLVRFITFPTVPMWLTYNIVNGSIPGMISDTFTMTSIIVAIFRYDIRLPFIKYKNIKQET